MAGGFKRQIDQKVENLWNELAMLEIQAEESRQRVRKLCTTKQARKQMERLMLSLLRVPNRMERTTPMETRCCVEVRTAS